MFGMLYALGMTVAATTSGIKAAVENAECIMKGKEDNNFTHTYTDRLGVTRDLTTHKKVSIGKDYNNPSDDCYLWIGTPETKIRNLSEEKRNLVFEDGKKGNRLGRTADIYDRRDWSISAKNKSKNYMLGALYKDLNTNDLYVCRQFSLYFNQEKNIYELYHSGLDAKTLVNCKFYMDVKTGFLVRKSDTQIEYEKNNNKYILSDIETKKFIKQFNEAQKNGGWHHGNSTEFSNDIKIMQKQNYYCDSFIAYDHVYNLVEMREKGGN